MPLADRQEKNSSSLTSHDLPGKRGVMKILILVLLIVLTANVTATQDPHQPSARLEIMTPVTTTHI